MTIVTKFNKGDEVWYMKNNKPAWIIISAIEVFYVGTNQDKISYNAYDGLTPVTWLDHSNLREDTLFLTKEDLLKSL